MTKQNIIKTILFFISVSVLVILPIKHGQTARDNPMQRYIIFKNDFSKDTIYPVVQAPLANWEKDNGGQRRIYVNVSPDIKGLPPGKQIRVNIPDSHWYQGGRIFIFTLDPLKYESLGFDNNQKSKINPHEKVDCGINFCEVGDAVAAYNDDAPAQLLEYTYDSFDPKTGKPPANGNFDDPDTIPMADIDVSYVDSVYLPVAMSLDDKGVTGYMGTIIPFDEFKTKVNEFLTQSKWSMYAAYAPHNWSNNVFHELIDSQSSFYQLPNVPSGNFIFKAVNRAFDNQQVPETSLYGLKGPLVACQAKDNAGDPLFPICMAKNLVGNCCANKQEGNLSIFDACCPQKKFTVDNTRSDQVISNSIYTAKNETAEIYAKRWKTWIDTDPCTDINKISKWPSSEKEFDTSKKLFFCNQFRDSVRYIWDHFKHDTSEPCNVGTEHERDVCTIIKIIAYKVPKNSYMSGKLPETLQAIMRGVPYIAASYDLYVAPKTNPDDKTRRNTFLITQDEKALYQLDEDGNQKLILDASALSDLLEKIKPGNTYFTDTNHPNGWSIKDDFTDAELISIDNVIQSKYKLPDSMLVPPSNYPIDKWLVFWNTYDTDENNLFSLNPYTHFVHDEKEGINAQSYSFSIDDKYGNFRDRALGFIVDVGGSSAILNLNMYDPYDQYKVNWAGNPGAPDKAWQQVTITPSDNDQGPTKTDVPIIIVGKEAVNPMNTHITFNRYTDKSPTKKFSYVTLVDAQGNHLDFKLSLETKTVKDNFTGKNGYTIQSLIKDDKYCEEHSSGDLQTICKNSNLSALHAGDIYYPQLFKEDRPKVNLNIGLPTPAVTDPVSFPVKWIKGEMTSKTKAKFSWPVAKLNLQAKGSEIKYQLMLDKDYRVVCETTQTSCEVDVSKDGDIPARVLAIITFQDKPYQAQIDQVVNLVQP